MVNLTLGIDDAGRGPVVGPMILAGCLIDEETKKYFKSIGVADSKTLTAKRREFLEEKIKERVKAFEIVLTKPNEIDSQNGNGVNLNDVEAMQCAEIINRINTGEEKMKVVIDCPSAGILKWADYLKTHIKNLSNLEISCEHKADRNHVVVAAASILAKCKREKEMDKIKKEYGNEIGSGYTSDPATIRFLAKYAIKYQATGIFRKTWITWKKAAEKLKQQTLDF